VGLPPREDSHRPCNRPGRDVSASRLTCCESLGLARGSVERGPVGQCAHRSAGIARACQPPHRAAAASLPRWRASAGGRRLSRAFLPNREPITVNQKKWAGRSGLAGEVVPAASVKWQREEGGAGPRFRCLRQVQAAFGPRPAPPAASPRSRAGRPDGPGPPTDGRRIGCTPIRDRPAPRPNP